MLIEQRVDASLPELDLVAMMNLNIGRVAASELIVAFSDLK